MATITMQVVAGAQNVVLSKTVSGADLLRFIAAYRALFALPALTDDEIVAAWMSDTFVAARKLTRAYEEGAAITTAKTNQTDITLT